MKRLFERLIKKGSDTMTTRTVRRTRPAEQPEAEAALDEAQQRIKWYFEENNLAGIRDEAVTLASKLALSMQHLQELSVLQEALRSKLQATMAHEYYSVVITDVERNGSLLAEVAGLGHSRVQVSVHPDVDQEQLLIGGTGFVSRERNCLLKVSAQPGRWKDIGSFEKYLDSPNRILVRDREALVAVDVAHHLRGTALMKHDLIGFDRDVAGMAYERIEAPQADDLFDEYVTDDFSQLGGLDKEIARIKHNIDFRSLYPQLATKYGLKQKCGILLKGVPGNGKTRIARCCAGYLRQLFPGRRCCFMHVSGSSDYSMWFGESERKLIERFNAVRQAAADGLVVMFWDEVDAIAKRRGTDHGSGAPDRILNTFLSQLDGVAPLENVIILFATNRADTLDPGLLRAGRIDEKIEIPAPNRRAAYAILHCYFDRGLPLAAAHEEADELIVPLLSRLFAPNGDFAEVATVKLSDGRRLPVAGRQLLSGAMLENVVNIAAQQAAVREAENGPAGVTEGDLALALETELVSAVSLLAPGNVKSYVASIPQDAQPIAVDPLLISPESTYVRTR
jgi:proteasome-associated ATPase